MGGVSGGSRPRGRWSRFGRFCVVGAVNTATDFGVMNALMALSGLYGGLAFAVQKSASFMVSAAVGYRLNRAYTFGFAKGELPASNFLRYLSVGLVNFVVNVAASTATVVAVRPLAEAALGLGWLGDVAWANLAMAAGSASGIAVSYAGCNLYVFRRAPGPPAEGAGA